MMPDNPDSPRATGELPFRFGLATRGRRPDTYRLSLRVGGVWYETNAAFSGHRKASEFVFRLNNTLIGGSMTRSPVSTHVVMPRCSGRAQLCAAAAIRLFSRYPHRACNVHVRVRPLLPIPASGHAGRRYSRRYAMAAGSPAPRAQGAGAAADRPARCQSFSHAM